MKNNAKLKKYLVITSIVSICLLVLFLIINIFEYRTYTKNFNNKISQLVGKVQEKYPTISEIEIIEILNDDENNKSDIFAKYGIDMDKTSILIENNKNYHTFLVLNMSFMIIVIILLVIIFLLYNKKKEKDIKNITKYIEEINKKNYELQIDSISEDELSILKNEIYKTTVMLKEAAENSNIDKINLKKSLEDISHQLKTPLTSILIMLDNLIDEPDMENSTREDFIRDIKREVVNINFLIQTILKLSKFDSNTIHFTKEDIEIKRIIDEAIKNVSTLCDLRNINIEVDGSGKEKINCDYRWQVEAITNILKNCVEHSKDNQKVIINYSQNSIYTKLEIKDFGDGISKKDLPHIFERFYKGENSSEESIGIGLALSKTIIEEDNGSINVQSDKNGTTFTIKYFYL